MNFFKNKKKSANTAEIEKIPTKVREGLSSSNLIEDIPLNLVKEFQAFVFEKNSDQISIAALDPKNEALNDFVSKNIKQPVNWYRATEADLAVLLKSCETKTEIQAELEKLLETAKTNKEDVSKLVDRIITYALAEKASDIHIEPIRDETVVRFRLDGELHTMFAIPAELQKAVIARVKILSGMKIDEYRRPQDGRVELQKLKDVSFRVSSIPVLYGEKIVLRVLDDSNKNLELSYLGFTPEQEEVLRRNMEKPHGLIVTTGPTGGGKTTTLYALINLLEKSNINIATLEEPIEYSLEGVNQTQINRRVELGFADGLRALLRQDPDVIMVGEIRDSETMIMAANAALTGHLVLTTMHTNDAPSAFNRFLEMKVEDFVVASTVNAVIAQRLVRKVCPNCAQKAPLGKQLKKKIEERSDIMAAVKSRTKAWKKFLDKKFTSGKGCDQCLKSGYSGRIGLFEIIEPDKKIRDLVLNHASADEIQTAAEKQGFEDIITHGLNAIESDITTFDEVLRTTKSN